MHMAKSLSFGNGRMLVMTDQFGRVRDIYYPYVGLENHAGGSNAHRLGVWVDGNFSWLDDGSWTIDVRSDLAYTGLTTAFHPHLGLEIHIMDVLSHESNIFLRRFKVHNRHEADREVRFFFNHQLEMYHSEKGDTAFYDPQTATIIHYEGKRAFLANARMDGQGISDYTVGIFRIEGKEGTYKDAEDGVLAKNAIEHGSVDSTLAMHLRISKNSVETFHYWFVIGDSILDVKAGNSYVESHGPDEVMHASRGYWHAWVERNHFNYYGLGEPVIDLFKKSQFILRSHVDERGGIIASGDSDMLQGGRDTYAYVWPRDAAYVAVTLDWMGERHSARQFFDFCSSVITEDGYLMHKYRSDTSLGSSWHGYMVNGHPELPIQEDETALILWALWEHWLASKDLDFIESMYNTFIEKAANFMVAYRDPYTGLPKPSYNLWEERFGVHTYTAATVYAGLKVAARFAEILGKDRTREHFDHVADEMQRAIVTHLYDETEGYFYRSLLMQDDGTMTFDKTLDASSVYGVFMFGVLPPDDERVLRAIEHTRTHLTVHTPVGGIARYQGDQYYRTGGHNEPGNPWFITTLWYTQHAILIAKDDRDLDRVRADLNWVERNMLRSGILSEQLSPLTSEQVGAAPLTWSHAEYLRTIIMYMRRVHELGLTPS